MKTLARMPRMMAAGLAAAAAACMGGENDVEVLDYGQVSASVEIPVQAEPAGATALVLTVAPEGNVARYRVRERLAGVDLPGDAVGETSRVTGAISLDAAGKVVPGESSILVDAAGLRSDADRRDGHVRRRLLETERHATVELRPTAIRGVSLPLPRSGTRTLELDAELTVRGFTRPTTWHVDARFEAGRVTGTASTAFTFADFGLEKPRVPVVASVSDSIRLEYDFTLIPATPAGP